MSKKSPSKATAVSEIEDGVGDDDADGGDSEYEIEAILEAKKDKVASALWFNKFQYFVKWMGYGREHNSWVGQDDAAGASELITKFWKDREKKSPKKAPDSAPSASVTKKRGRNSPSEKPADKDDNDRFAKKQRKTTGKQTVLPATLYAEASPEDKEEIGTMAEHMHVANWDHLIEAIETVERVDQTLLVYFTLYVSGLTSVLVSEMNVRPEKELIDFYQSKLRWRETPLE
ncbi:hypothetical protein B0H13DRAFT_1911532 [Mycena leptocephala]|nr:hypothetical protein B0H13DRAFT_1911532 [Mycena leptocephala]